MLRIVQHPEFGFVPPPSFHPPEFSQSPEQFAKAFPAHLQRFAQEWVNAPPASIVGTPGPLLGINTSPEAFAKPFNIALQQYSAYFGFTPPSIAVTPGPLQGINPYPEQFAKPFRPELQRFPDFAPQGAIISITPQGGYYEGLSLQFRTPFNPALQQFTGFVFVAPFQYRPFSASPEQFRAPLASAQQQFGNSYAFLAPSPFVSWRLQPWPEQFAKAFDVKLQQHSSYTGFTPPAPPGVTITEFFSQSPEQFKIPMSPILQQYSAYAGFTPSPLGFGKRKPLLLQNSSGTAFGGGASYWPDNGG